MTKCPNCESEEIEVTEAYGLVYYILCKKCGEKSECFNGD